MARWKIHGKRYLMVRCREWGLPEGEGKVRGGQNTVVSSEEEALNTTPGKMNVDTENLKR